MRLTLYHRIHLEEPLFTPVTINNLLADLFIRQYFPPNAQKSKFAKQSPRQTFPLYGNVDLCKQASQLIFRYVVMHAR